MRARQKLTAGRTQNFQDRIPAFTMHNILLHTHKPPPLSWQMGTQRHWSLSPRFCTIVTTRTTPLGMPGHPSLHQSLSRLPSGFSTIATCPRKPLVTSFAFLSCSEQLKHLFTGSLATPPNTPLITDRCLAPTQTQADPTLDAREGEGNHCHCPRGVGGAGGRRTYLPN